VTSSSDAIGGGRFAPGTVLEGRYRIVALAGRGGMGEVYRADDLKLGQTVAIKFLPESLSRDAGALQRFHSEVRIARQVSHPNVCRMFDVGEVDGMTFLTMEFVDGEDLASLLRRIGRLPQDKAIEVARQICAGLAAAHDKGVIHRDLKPANIMLDGLGKIRINDFGLAGIAANIHGAEARAGTPAYMAPEQLCGSEVTVRSDIYALGLVLYEILTGKRAFEAVTLPELIRKRDQLEITRPSLLVRDLDAILEQVILRCLDRDPMKRPSTALQVAAALPGGDPLAAALAAGETPSPEMVAAAGEAIGLSRRSAMALLAAVLLGIFVFMAIEINENGLDRLPLENPPEVLEKKSREILAKIGYEGRPTEKASGFNYDGDLLEFVKDEKPQPDWNSAYAHPASLFRYWYRQSPKIMMAKEFWNTSFTPGVIGEDDPPKTLPGMVNLQLDAEGRLLYFMAVPPEKEAATQAAVAPHWGALFDAAQLDPQKFRSVEPEWTANVTTDSRAAWEGTWPGTARELRIEAAGFHGKPVFFRLLGPWTKPANAAASPQTLAQRVAQIVGLILTLSLIFIGIWLARRNYVTGRGDIRGAWRVAAAVFGVEMLVCLFRAHFVAGFESVAILGLAVSTALLVCGVLFVVYLALEPYVRRNWPQTIISWTRLLDGRFRDPMVGRDVLTGTLLGIFWCVVLLFGYLLKMKHGASPILGNTDYMLGARITAGLWLSTIVASMLGVMNFFFLLVLLRILVRNRWLAAGIFVVVFALPKIAGSDYVWTDAIAWTLVYIIAAYAVVRFGLMSLAMAIFVANTMLNVPCTRDISRWYAPYVLSVILIFAAIAVWGAYTSLGGKKLVKADLFA